MLAKPLEFAEGTALPTKNRQPASVSNGETAWAKRRQGIWQAAGSFADSSRLIQLRKSVIMEADPLTIRGKQYRCDRQGEITLVPSESSKIVACQKRSV